jgi:alkyl sulfatase BDS1-like metallo-beta-lactamase superfamily hydrolase
LPERIIQRSLAINRSEHSRTSGALGAMAALADYVLANDSTNANAKKVKAQALVELGERQVNAIARNYYLSSAMYLLRDEPPPQ